MSQKLSKKQLDMFKKILLDQLKETQDKLKGTVDELGSTPTEVMPDLSDRATQETEVSFGLRVKDRDQKLIEKLKEALDRIKDGSFGVCESCGDLIEVDRLKARPVATLCIDCKTDQERDERSRGE
jgi:DnaK suppressor protein